MGELIHKIATWAMEGVYMFKLSKEKQELTERSLLWNCPLVLSSISLQFYKYLGHTDALRWLELFHAKCYVGTSRAYFIEFAICSNSRATIELGAFFFNSLQTKKKLKRSLPPCAGNYNLLQFGFIVSLFAFSTRHTPFSTFNIKISPFRRIALGDIWNSFSRVAFFH